MSARQGEWRTELPATLEAVEQFCVDFRLWRARACAGLEAFPAELLIREALTNSVIHGCKEDATQRIFCVLRAKPGRLLIAIQDQGKGFNWRAARGRLTDLSDTHGRGVEIYKLFATSVRFNSKGNVVLLVKRFLKGETI